MYVSVFATLQISHRVASASQKMAKVLVGTRALPHLPPALSLTKEGHTRILVRAKPGAKRNNVVAINEALEVQIAEQAREGKANSELTEFIAEVLDLRKAQVSLDRGQKSRDKVVVVHLTPEETLARLQSLLEES
eukprot:TRINITY_DN7677_c0_g1_i1.p1 TRINITY_DN7677_c0_g1~~TRINITY_DN7677_c0_g1_i1.p1  ORF type:complete len:135 (+),score=28.16 TRINITY_DN7677_c0_g1_i1:383-787(+)